MKLARWLFAAIVCPATAWAHPIDKVVQGAYLFLTPNIVRLELNLTPGTGVVGGIVATIDTDRNSSVGEDEAWAYAEDVLGSTKLIVDGQPATWSLESVVVPPMESLMLGDMIKIFAVAKHPDVIGTRNLTFENTHEPAMSQWTANVFLQPADEWQFTVTDQERSDNGQRLTVTYEASHR